MSASFPAVETALKNPNGLLCRGGDLSPHRLREAYRHGIFPWYNKGDPILWWSPDPRAVLFFEDLHISKSLQKCLKHSPFEITFNEAYREIMLACAQPRREESETWISPEIIEAYCALNALGDGLSVACWQNKRLVGGIYGVRVGKLFVGQSMFSAVSNASKVALVALIDYLKKENYLFLDCQIMNPHLQRLGAVEISRQEYLAYLAQALS